MKLNKNKHVRLGWIRLLEAVIINAQYDLDIYDRQLSGIRNHSTYVSPKIAKDAEEFLVSDTCQAYRDIIAMLMDAEDEKKKLNKPKTERKWEL